MCMVRMSLHTHTYTHTHTHVHMDGRHVFRVMCLDSIVRMTDTRAHVCRMHLSVYCTWYACTRDVGHAYHVYCAWYACPERHTCVVRMS